MSSNSSSSSSGGIGFVGLLTIAFIVLKLCKVIKRSWLWVLSPLWVSALITLAIVIIWLLGFVVYVLVKHRKEEK